MTDNSKMEMPMGFTAALSRNSEALQKFTDMSTDEKRMILEGTHSVSSKKEMQDYVQHIADMY